MGVFCLILAVPSLDLHLFLEPFKPGLRFKCFPVSLDFYFEICLLASAHPSENNEEIPPKSYYIQRGSLLLSFFKQILLCVFKVNNMML